MDIICRAIWCLKFSEFVTHPKSGLHICLWPMHCARLCLCYCVSRWPPEDTHTTEDTHRAGESDSIIKNKNTGLGSIATQTWKCWTPESSLFFDDDAHAKQKYELPILYFSKSESNTYMLWYGGLVVLRPVPPELPLGCGMAALVVIRPFWL